MNIRNRTAMMNLPTAYEMVLVINGVTIDVLGYTARKTRASLMKAASSNGETILKTMTEEEKDMEWKYSADNGLSFGRGNVVVRFSGRTERDVANEQGRI